MIGDAPLREIVGADALRAVAGADLAAAGLRPLGIELCPLEIVEPGAQHLHRLGLVLVLRLLILLADHEARRQMGDAHRAVRGVHRLAPRPACRNTSMRKSFSSILISTSSASGSTATVAAEVWMRPCASVSGTRCTRCTPDSNFSRANTPLPVILAMISLYPPVADSLADSTFTFQPMRSA